MTAQVFCWDCASHGEVHRVTANLRCACGSADVDLFDPSSPRQQHRIATVTQIHMPPEPMDFVAFMTKAAGPVGTEIPGWDVYKGPMPGPNPMQNSDDPHMQPRRCPVCKGSGYDISDRTRCRECGGTGFMTPSTTPEPPAVARHNYPSTQTTIPFIGKRKRAAKPSVTTEQSRAAKAPDWWKPTEYSHAQEAPLILRGASCPNCDSPNTHLVTAANGGWWSCPNCGPMVNIDKHPNVDPYNPPKGFKPQPRSFKSASKRDPQSSRIVTVISSVAKQNPGLMPHEVVGLARETVRRYPEAQ